MGAPVIFIQDRTESIKCPSCPLTVVRPIGAATICACTTIIEATKK